MDRRDSTLSGMAPWRMAEGEKIFATLAPPGAGAERIAPILTALQQAFGYVDSRAIAALAPRLGVERGQIYQVMAGMRGLRRLPPAAGALKICRAEACRKQGAEALVAHLERRHGFRLDSAAPPGAGGGPAYCLRTAYCLGACGRGPNMLVAGALCEGVTVEKLDALIAALPKI